MGTTQPTSAPYHTPVMTSEVMEFLCPAPGDVILDATLGCGGHASLIASALGAGGFLIGVDRDPSLLPIAAARLASAPCRKILLQANFADLPEICASAGVSKLNGVLADLGLCTAQLQSNRGFSFRCNGHLSMQMTPGDGPTAEDLVNSLSERELGRIFREYGEERWARRIAARIVEERSRGRISSALQLAKVIERAVPSSGRPRIHPATRCFQALRMVVNRELENLERFLSLVPNYLASGGRVVILSYHSLEDRRVKLSFRDEARRGVYELLTKKVVRPRADEVRANPSSRSARLRAARRMPE